MNEEIAKAESQALAGDGLGDAAGQATGAQGSAGAEAGPETGAAGTTESVMVEELTQVRAQVTDLSNRLARAQADHDNYRRRAQKEREDVSVYANQRLLLNLLPILDNLERALSSAPAPGDEKLRQGVELTARSFRDALAKEGVTVIEAVGQPFDPNLYEAVMTVEIEDYEDGSVVAELQKGYRLGDRVIRPSMVQVNKRA